MNRNILLYEQFIAENTSFKSEKDWPKIANDLVKLGWSKMNDNKYQFEYEGRKLYNLVIDYIGDEWAKVEIYDAIKEKEILTDELNLSGLTVDKIYNKIIDLIYTIR
jgi:hypothetical protein